MKKLLLGIAIAVVIAALTATGLEAAGRSNRSLLAKTVRVTSTNNPKTRFPIWIHIVPGSTCNETTRSTFKYRLGNLPSYGIVQLDLYDLSNTSDAIPIAGAPSNIRGGIGLIRVNYFGKYTGRWPCWYSWRVEGPGYPPAAPGSYGLSATDVSSGISTGVYAFTVTK